MTKSCSALRYCIIIIAALTCSSATADDNLIAQRLYDRGSFAEAAEIYTDPAWKGVALYKSAQWWRAAEAFVRADTADAYYNLGNAYVKLGYYALALDAYKAALSKRSPFDDAAFNADLMRQLLAQDEEEGSDSAMQRQAEEIDRVETDKAESGNSGEAEDDDTADVEKSGEDREGDTDSRGPTPEASSQGDSGEAGSDDTLQDEDSTEGGSVKGTESEQQQERSPSGGSEGKEISEDAQAAGLRAHLEAEQATEQWLNQIKHDPLKYLQRRIELEINRRRAAGESAPQGGSQW